MIHRLRRYRDNLGVANAVLGVLFVGYFTWRMLQLSNVLAMVFFAAFGLVFFITPLALMPLLLPRPQFAVRCIKFGQYAIYGVIILAIVNVVAIPAAAGLALMMGIYFYMGLVFWFFSSPQIMTNEWASALGGTRPSAREKAVLIEAITRDQQLLDDENA